MQTARVLAIAALLAAAAGIFADPAKVQTLRTPPKRQELKLLYVLEYDCMFDWEPISLEQELTDGVLAWMTNLHDRLTVTSRMPLGEELMVSLERCSNLIVTMTLCLATFMLCDKSQCIV